MGRVLTIRQLSPELHQALRDRAARNGRSVEGEVRHILAETCLNTLSGDWAAGLRDRARHRTAGRPQTDAAALPEAVTDGG
jgi:hypothetical protein